MKTVILGAGLGGLSAAIALAPRPVIVVSPCPLGEGCSSAWAQGGIAAAIGREDRTEDHIRDTLDSGAGINDAAIVRQTIEDAAPVIERLIQSGVFFDKAPNGDLLFGLEAAHGRNRIVHAKDATGLIVMQAMIAAARATPSIEFIEHARATDLSIEDGSVSGVVLLSQSGNELRLPTRQIVLATGGSTALWRETTNPHENWGSGMALAARAGATLGDLEFVQFHPTAIAIGRDPMPLASEALRGEGAILVTEEGKRFTDELQSRDVVARAIWDQIRHGHSVFLDARDALGEEFAARFPTIHGLCASANIDPSKQPIPIRPAAHYHMGGVLTDPLGRTDVEGLWACGEVACTGLHGANRLASNSLLEAASFGWKVAQDIKGQPVGERKPAPEPVVRSINRQNGQRIAEIRALMSDNVGVIRNKTLLGQAIDFLSPLATRSDAALVGLMIAQCAFRREESRGAHFRSDFPQTESIGRRSCFRLSDLELFP